MLATAPCARSAHFAVHFLDARASDPGHARRTASREPSTGELSTASCTAPAPPVDDLPVPVPQDDTTGPVAPAPAWLGAVVPKRHARRAVTRSLLKRQVRAAVGRVAACAARDASAMSDAATPSAPAGGLPGGLWVVRLRAPYPRDAFPSAASDALRDAVRTELDALLAAAVRRCTGASADAVRGGRPARRGGRAGAAVR